MIKFETTRNATIVAKSKTILSVNLDKDTISFNKEWWEDNKIDKLAHSVITDGKVFLVNSNEGLIRAGKAKNLVDKLKVAYPGINRFDIKSHNQEVAVGENPSGEYYELVPLRYVAPREFTEEQLEELKERGKRLAQSRYDRLNDEANKSMEDYTTEEEIDSELELV